MRITGGKYRGKKIESREDKGLRPTTAKARQSIFNILKHGGFIHDDDFIGNGSDDLIEGQIVVDIFCGTGALGLEALSYGASRVFFVDQNQQTLSLARSNAESLGEIKNCGFVKADSTQLPTANTRCTLAFIDPPYNRNLATPAFKTLHKNNWLEYGAVIVLEQGNRDELPDLPEFQLLNTREKDKTILSIYQYTYREEIKSDEA